MTIDLSRRYVVNQVLPSGPELAELRALVFKHRTAGPNDVLTAAAVNAALEAEQAEQALDLGAAEQLASTVAEVRALRLLAESSQRDALYFAALVYQGRAHDVGTEAVLQAADDFAAWLRGEPAAGGLPEAEQTVPAPTPARLRPVDGLLDRRDQPVYDPPLVRGTKVLGYDLAELHLLTDQGTIDRLADIIRTAVDHDYDQPGERSLLMTALAILRRQR